MGQLVSMFPVQVVQGVQGVEDLRLCDPRPPQPLEEVNLLDGETRLLTLLEHPAGDQNNSIDGNEKRHIKCCTSLYRSEANLM